MKIKDTKNNTKVNEVSVSISSNYTSANMKIEHDKKITPIDALSLPSQNKEEEILVPSYNHALKQRARSQSKKSLTKVKDYCEKEMKNNYYLRFANLEDADASFLYFDFYYTFLYCQTQKVPPFM